MCIRDRDEWVGKTEVTDVYCVEEGSVVLSRQVRILKESEYPGIRLRTEDVYKRQVMKESRKSSRLWTRPRDVWMPM